VRRRGRRSQPAEVPESQVFGLSAKQISAWPGRRLRRGPAFWTYNL